MKAAQLIVRSLSPGSPKGWLDFGPFRWPCALGRSGIRSLKREGDGATPRGRHRLEYAYFRPDRVRRPESALKFVPCRKAFGWCDAPGDANYNRLVQHPYPASAERLWREDGLYDCVVVLGYNLSPRSRGRGSAIFLHIARPGYGPTEGCVAVRADHLRRLLTKTKRRTFLIVP